MRGGSSTRSRREAKNRAAPQCARAPAAASPPSRCRRRSLREADVRHRGEHRVVVLEPVEDYRAAVEREAGGRSHPGCLRPSESKNGLGALRGPGRSAARWGMRSRIGERPERLQRNFGSKARRISARSVSTAVRNRFSIHDAARWGTVRTPLLTAGLGLGAWWPACASDSSPHLGSARAVASGASAEPRNRSDGMAASGQSIWRRLHPPQRRRGGHHTSASGIARAGNGRREATSSPEN